MKQNLIFEINEELDIIRTIARLTRSAVQTDSEEAGEDRLIAVFNDIEKHYWKIGELFEQLQNEFPCLLSKYQNV
jgi:hypothetical protein